MIPNGPGCSAPPGGPGAAPATPNFLHSLERGLIVMRLFTPQQPELTLGGAAAATGMSRATARRFLLTLAGLSCVRADGQGFRPAPGILRLVRACARRRPTARPARWLPVLSPGAIR